MTARPTPPWLPPDALSPPLTVTQRSDAELVFRRQQCADIVLVKEKQLTTALAYGKLPPAKQIMSGSLSSDELEQYEFQLGLVRKALEADPENAEMRKLESDLQEVIALSRSLAAGATTASTAAAESSSGNHEASEQTPADEDAQPRYKIGDVVAAKWSQNGKYYEATISALSTRTGDQLCSVVFKGYTNVELIKMSDIKPFDPSLVVQSHKRGNAQPLAAAASSPVPTTADSKKSHPHNKTAHTAKKEKYVARQAEIEAQHRQQQSSWLQFASGAAGGNKKRKMTGAGSGGILKKKSMFASPDSPYGKVGVVGSGKGMTNYDNRERHQFDYNSNGGEEAGP
ncbi:hypothetical protein RI367_003158 [Sorochytrium milnesiophthora]